MFQKSYGSSNTHGGLEKMVTAASCMNRGRAPGQLHPIHHRRLGWYSVRRGKLGECSVDIVDRRTRSRMMGRIRGKNTQPEMAVRTIAHRLGYRFRLHRRDLPGCPDLVFPRRRKVVFVHGCYWHRHPGCRFAYTPKSNVEFWLGKFAANEARDEAALKKLKAEGWDPLVIWECESADPEKVAAWLLTHLGAP